MTPVFTRKRKTSRLIYILILTTIHNTSNLSYSHKILISSESKKIDSVDRRNTMAAITNPFSMSTMFNALQDLSFNPARETMYEEPPTIPPPLDGDSLSCCETSAGLTDHPEISEMDLAWVFNFMTRSEDVPRFKDVISMLDWKQLQRMVYILTSDSGYFMDIARTKNGSKSLQKLMGKSDDVDAFFYAVIMRLFFQVMTDKHASYVAIKGMQVFQVRKELLYEKVLQYALHLARDEHGCIALNEVITDLDDPYFRNQLLDIVAYNALLLSNDAYGNFVVQHVLKLYDLRSTRNIAVNLRGHFVELSFKKYGSYIVERLLEAEDSVMELVVMDLLECEGERLMRLARSEYGNFVVKKGLVFTRNIYTAHLFDGLVYKLMPFRHLLPRSPGRNIAIILDSFPVPY